MSNTDIQTLKKFKGATGKNRNKSKSKTLSKIPLQIEKNYHRVFAVGGVQVSVVVNRAEARLVFFVYGLSIFKGSGVVHGGNMLCGYFCYQIILKLDNKISCRVGCFYVQMHFAEGVKQIGKAAGCFDIGVG